MTTQTPTPPPWAHKVLELLAEQRREQQWLAAATGCSKAQLSRVLSGSRRAAPEHVAAMARALGVPPHWLEDPKP